MCWTALDRVARLADEGVVPANASWRAAAERVREWVESEGWDDAREAPTSVRRASETSTRASSAWRSARTPIAADERFQATVETIRRELGRGPFLFRFTGADEIEGAFLTCSFWLVDALARAGRRDEAAELMDELVASANDVGLYAEEIDPESGEFLGNMPQGLVHLALVNAAVSLAGGDDPE